MQEGGSNTQTNIINYTNIDARGDQILILKLPTKQILMQGGRGKILKLTLQTTQILMQGGGNYSS